MMELLHSKIIGTGKPLLILHGFLGTGDNWKSHANKLAKDGYEVHLIDQRNHGRSFHSNEFNYTVMVEDLMNYITHHNIVKPHVLGHSMGGKTAMSFAVKHSDNIDKLVIADIAPKAYPEHHNAILKALNSVDFKVQNSRKLVDKKLAEFIPEFGIRAFLAKNIYWKEKDTLGFRFNLPILTQNYAEIVTELTQNSFFEGETLFLKGEKSAYITQNEETLIKTHFKKASIETVSNAGHWLHSENPTEFYTKLIQFLNS